VNGARPQHLERPRGGERGGLHDAVGQLPRARRPPDHQAGARHYRCRSAHPVPHPVGPSSPSDRFGFFAAMADVPAVNDLQAVAYHMFTQCKDNRTAFSECMAGASKPGECEEQYKAMMGCAKDL